MYIYWEYEKRNSVFTKNTQICDVLTEGWNNVYAVESYEKHTPI